MSLTKKGVPKHTLIRPLDAETEVVEIEGKQVILSRNGQQRTLHLAIGF